jgi:two-component system, sensor histidine kinase YesM
MRYHKLQTKFFFAYFVLVVLILLFFSIFFYKNVSDQLITRGLDSLSTLNTSFEDQIDSVVRDMDAVSININYSSLVKEKLDSSFHLDTSRNSLKSLASLFVTINGADIKVDQMYLYDLSGNVLKVGIKTNTNQIEKTDISTIPWWNQVIDLDGKKLISNAYKSSALSTSYKYSDYYISVYRTFENQFGTVVGAVETVKRCKSIFKTFTHYNKTADDPARIYVYASDGSLIYPYNLSDEEKDSMFHYSSFTSKDAGTTDIINEITGHKEYLAYSHSAYTDWTYVTVQPESYILKPVNRLLNILLLFTLGLLLASLVVSYCLSRSLTKPVIHLKQIVQRIEIETLGKEHTTDFPMPYIELHELYTAFQHMSEKLKVSMNELIDSRQQELKSRTLALQSQVNPHFYYNTLYSIILLAENDQSKEVIMVCRNLSNMMRYITDTNQPNVCIRSEIDYLQKYLYCMKVRYQSSLSYSIDVDDILLDLEVPKLIIQPLVENALKYGTSCAPPWSISIVGRVYDTHWQIDVIDSGTGFTEEAIQTISNRINEVNHNPGMPEMQINGLGIINVYLRWKIFCQDTMIFNYGNTAEGHGVMSIGQRISLTREEKEEL